MFVIFNSNRSFAQQNLFNVPSAEITKQKQIFVQQQFNFLATATSNTTIDYGLGNNWEIGINVFNVDLYSQQNQWNNPLFLLNFQKSFELTSFWKIGIGSQSGPTLPVYDSKVQLASFNYLNNALDLGGWGKYFLGVYYANQGYVGNGTNVNLMAGIELPTPIDTVHFMADYIGGNNAIGAAVIGLVWQATAQWQLSLGAQVPTPESASHEYGIVVEITHL
ncbi:MAG: hypothetical protein HOP02_05755 [Methylococcaceae bacterium]|nr:hypothetical protein [Methylococcaceae bacterium]